MSGDPNGVGLRHEIDADGILTLTFDRPDSKVNLLDRATLQLLDEILEALARRDDVRGVLVESAKPGHFLAGLDVAVLASLKDAYEAAQGARQGQEVFSRLATSPVPSACLIDGACFGGGAELALACTFRLCSDRPEVRIGFPEVRLGIVPGFGGTQRLPRLIGLKRSLDLVVSGRAIRADEARRIGLVDRIVPTPRLRREALALLAAGARPGARDLGARAVRDLIGRIAPLRRLVVSRVRRRVEARYRPSDYPAPYRVLEAIEAAYSLPLEPGLDVESRIVGDLVPTRTSRNLVVLFEARGALRAESAEIGAAPRKVRKLAVVGAGLMGSGIARLAASREVPVRMKDVGPDAILRGMRGMAEGWADAVRRGRFEPRDAARLAAFVAPTIDDSGISRADLVIEAVVEDLAVKQQVLATVEERISERAVFASNTSTLPIEEIGARALRPERVVGLHFFHPVDRMPLVEVIPGPRTSPEAVATARCFAMFLGKTPVLVRDSPGFLVNRILLFYLNEALRLLGEGVGIDAVDRAMKEFGMPVGPFGLMDEIGLDTLRHAAAVLESAFGKRAGSSGSVLGALAEQGRLGVKSGRGFYRYRDRRRIGTDSHARRIVGSPPRRELPLETVQERLVLSMVNEAAVCLEDGVVREPRDADVAMVFGTGFPSFRGGPFRYIDAEGVPAVVDRLSRLADAHGERFRPAALLREMSRESRTFYRER